MWPVCMETPFLKVLNLDSILHHSTKIYDSVLRHSKISTIPILEVYVFNNLKLLKVQFVLFRTAGTAQANYNPSMI